MGTEAHCPCIDRRSVVSFKTKPFFQFFSGANPDYQSVSGGTPLTRAIMANNLDIVVQLVKAGANLDLVDTKGSNALFTVLSVKVVSVPRDFEQKHIVHALVKGQLETQYLNICQRI